MFNRPDSATASLRTSREDLLEQLRLRGITDEAVLKAIAKIPREEFVPATFRHRAWEDGALPISCNQTISQPFTVAFQTQLLEAKSGMNVLEIGTGSGYQAAVLWALGLRVFTIERHADLLSQARQRLEAIGCNVAMRVADGTVGWSAFAPFDRIIVTAGAPAAPPALLRQLAANGRMVIPIGEKATQRMKVFIRQGESDQFEEFDHGDFKFVPLIGREGWEKE
ncbi:MAG: protein-L-isoaspartate(D-aspartate) O-methyltransferase [Candidatus Kapabacteria bacterium]|nr:protein-L-isoaspartate(D-aspartate) O-methyltransferase [Candidatus Kapabacteria bacterium]